MLEEFQNDPHRLLGLHRVNEEKVIRLWRPRWSQVLIKVKGEVKRANLIDSRGLFELSVELSTQVCDYLISYESGLIAHDPYAFLPTFTKEDESLFAEGKHEEIYDVMGGRLTTHQGIAGVKFSVWAPCARGVSLVGDFNLWNTELHPMRLMGSSGVWELFVPGLKEGEKYKFYLISSEGHPLYKSDPYAFQGEMRPQTASVVVQIDHHQWKDEAWMQKRRGIDHFKRPINIYEVHLGSWKKEGVEFMSYRSLASKLPAYCKEMGYTHVEFMPVMGHPFDESWGYQVTGFYAISRRHGTVEDFQYLVDTLHQHEIGILLDWVPGHFPTDAHSIVQFDGTYLYEHIDPRQGYHPHWNTHIFNYGRYEVANFLLGSALFYIEKMHVDGLRVDAVSSIVYLDYGRREGEWILNEKGGNENLEGITFLQNLNETVHRKYPGVLMVAEAHSFPGITDCVSLGGLGFDFKWNLGWMHDTLNYLKEDFSARFSRKQAFFDEIAYYYEEKHLLPLSHDEVVHEKKSLLSKMPGNQWEKFANLRLLLSYMICHPGKKLLFMGGEFGQWDEWNCKEELPWVLTNLPLHQKLKNCVRDLNYLYQTHPSFWERDFEAGGFELVERDQTCSYLRHGEKETLLCVHNLSHHLLENYCLPYKKSSVIEIFNTDAQEYGGYGIINSEVKCQKDGIYLNLSPFSTSIYKPI